MRILGALEVRGKWCFQAKYEAGVDNSLADSLHVANIVELKR